MFDYELSHPFEVLLVELYFLSVDNGFVKYEIVKDFCKKEKLDYLELYTRLKIILARVKSE